MMNVQEKVLSLLKGKPLGSKISNEVLSDIREITAEIPLGDLLNRLNRTNSAVLLSRVSNMAPKDQELVEEALMQSLKLPQYEWNWFVDDLTPMDPFQVDFKLRTYNVMVILQELFRLRNIYEDESQVETILVLSQYYLPSPWCETTTAVMVKEILSHEINDEVLQRLVKSIQDDFKSLKSTKISQAGFRKINDKVPSGLRPKLGIQIEDDRYDWKKSRISSISRFSYLLSNLNSKSIKDYWWLITPTILNILDDHEGPIKLQGVKLLNQMLDMVDPKYFQMTGLEPVFYDAVRPLLNYLPKLTPTTLTVEILSISYPTLIKLFSISPMSQSDKLIELLNSGIFTTISTVRDNHEILLVLMNQINSIIKILELQTLKVFPRLFYSLAMILSDPFIDTSPYLFHAGLDTLITFELNTWPRLRSHKYDILGLVVICYSRTNDDEVKDKLKTIIKLLERVIGEKELIDDYKQLLLKDGSLGDILGSVT